MNGMPYNLEAEQSLLGCMLIDNEIVSELLGTLSEKDFYAESHQYIIIAIKRVYADRKPIDLITLTDALEKAGTLEQSGGIAYVTELMQITPSAANYKTYYEIVKRDGTNRSMIRVAREITEYAQQGNESEQTIRFAEERVYGISERMSSSEMHNVRDGVGLDKVLDKFQKLSENSDAYRGLMTGFIRLDKLTNGLQKANLIVLAARPGMGKTALAMNIIEHAALYGDKVCAVFSLEMSETEILTRLLCSVSGVDMATALSGKTSIGEFRRLIKANDIIRKHDIEISESPIVTPAEILSKCRRIKAKHGGRLDLIVIDYIQLMHASDSQKSENRVQEVASITRDLKCMAKELDVPVLALSQLCRIKENREPQLSDLRESGAIEQDADIVMFINRPDVGLADEEIQQKQIVKGMAYLTIAKNRHGGLEKIPLRFKGGLTKFVNPELNETPETRAEHK